jgi:hypothetical protein
VSRTKMVGKTRKTAVQKGPVDKRPWVEPLGLLPALEALGIYICRKWYDGNLQAMKLRKKLYSKTIKCDAYNFWAENFPEAFTRYKAFKKKDLTDHLIVDRIRYQWVEYRILEDGSILKIDHERSKEHKTINKVHNMKVVPA